MSEWQQAVTNVTETLRALNLGHPEYEVARGTLFDWMRTAPEDAHDRRLQNVFDAAAFMAHRAAWILATREESGTVEDAITLVGEWARHFDPEEDATRKPSD